jgi:GTPase SAR1 family protein
MPKKAIKVIDNPEKDKHEKWSPQRDLLDFPRPFRWAVLGSVSCGKTSLILNYLINSSPYSNIFIMHPQTYNPNIPQEDEAKNANILVSADIPEYTGVEFHGLAYLPSMTFFDEISDKHNLFIIDDIDLCSYLKKRREVREERLNKLFSYVSSHKNLSIIVSSQDASSQLPGFILKMANVITVYQIRDQFIIATLARKLSVSYKRLQKLLSLCKNKHDSITFDYIEDSPAELRYNIFTPIKEK